MRIRFCWEKILIHVLNKKIKLVTKLKVFLEISIFVKTMWKVHDCIYMCTTMHVQIQYF